MSQPLLTVAQVAWIARGREFPEGLESKVHEGKKSPLLCYLCGCPSASWVPRKDCILQTFNDGPSAQRGTSQWVCVACVWSMKNRAVERTKEGELSPGGKPKLAPWLRIFSLLVVHDDRGSRCELFSKSEKRELRAAIHKLTEEWRPGCLWGLCLSDSGQKQLAWRTPLNNQQAGGIVRFEELLLRISWINLWPLVELVDELRAHYTLAEIASGQWSINRVIQHGIDNHTEAERRIAPLRGGPLLDIAMWLSLPTIKEVAVEPEGNTGGAGGEPTSLLAEQRGPQDDVGPHIERPARQRRKQRDMGEDCGGAGSAPEHGPEPILGPGVGEQGAFSW